MAEVVLFGRVSVPAGAMNHSTFRRWIRTIEVPRVGYRRVRAVDGWRKSRVFDAQFRIVQSTDPLGDAAYRLESR